VTKGGQRNRCEHLDMNENGVYLKQLTKLLKIDGKKEEEARGPPL